MLCITRNYFQDVMPNEVTRFKRYSYDPAGLGRIVHVTMKCRRAKVLASLPFGYAVLWTFGQGWIE